MKITCNREKFLAAFQTAASVAPTRSPKPILQNVKLEAAESDVIMLATDLEIGVRIHVAGVEVQSPGAVILPISRFGAILRESSDEQLRIETDGQGTIVRGQRSEFRLAAEDPAEFPAVAPFTEAKFHETPARLLRELIRRTIYATDNESSRYALGGVLLEFTPEKITAVGTDGRRLAKMEIPARSVGGHESGDATTIVPTRSMQLIERALTDGDAEVQIASRPNELVVQSPRATIFTRLVEGRFPRWRDVFPQRTGATRIDVAVGPLLAAVRQAAIVTSDESRGVDFTFAAGQALLSGRAAEIGQSRVELPLAYDGPEVGIMLDPRYLQDFLKVLDAEKIMTLEIKDAESAAVCETDDGYGYVIMLLARDHRSRSRERFHFVPPVLCALEACFALQAKAHGERRIALFAPINAPAAARPQRRKRDPRLMAGKPKPIGGILSELLARRGYARVIAAGVSADAWRKAAGETLAPHSRAGAARRGVLDVFVTNSTLAQEFSFEKQAILARLRELLPDEAIRDLKIRVGPLA